MPNLSYCRYQNTLIDLRACHRTLLDDAQAEEEGGEAEPLSAEEAQARHALIRLCHAITLGFGPHGDPLPEPPLDDPHCNCPHCAT